MLKNLATIRDLWLICRSCVVSVSDSSDAVDDIVVLRCVVSFLACDHSYITTGDILLINLATTDDHTGGILLCAVLLYYIVGPSRPPLQDGDDIQWIGD